MDKTQSTALIVIASILLAVLSSVLVLNVSENGLEDKIDALNSKLVIAEDNNAAQVVKIEALENPVIVEDPATIQSNSDKIDALTEKVNEDDNFEEVSEEIALTEIEKRSYKELFEFLEVTYGDIVDKEDIEYVIVRDVDTTIDDLNDEDSTVEFDLKVKYENDVGTDVKKYFTATVTIEEGEVEDLVFA